MSHGEIFDRDGNQGRDGLQGRHSHRCHRGCHGHHGCQETQENYNRGKTIIEEMKSESGFSLAMASQPFKV